MKQEIKVSTTNKNQKQMNNEIIESIFGCLERIEEKFFDERSGKADYPLFVSLHYIL